MRDHMVLPSEMLFKVWEYSPLVEGVNSMVLPGDCLDDPPTLIRGGFIPPGIGGEYLYLMIVLILQSGSLNS